MGVVTTVYDGDMLFETRLGRHRITVDGPAEWGGQDRGPMPPQLFMASIGSCVGVLITHFCDDHQLDTTGLRIDVNYDVASHPTRFHNIMVVVDLPNARCDDDCTRRALANVAEHCPVHETMATFEKVTFEINTA